VPGERSARRRGAALAVRRRRPAGALRLGARRGGARAAGEDPLPPRLRGPLPGLRQGPERRSARPRGARGGPSLGRARVLERAALDADMAILAAAHGGPEEEDLEGAARQAADASCARAAARERVPELRPPQAPAPRLPH